MTESGGAQFVVAPDGSGTHRGLAEAVAAAAPGAAIRLAAGTHRLERGLLFDKPVTLIGAGMDATRLEADVVRPGTKRIAGQADFVLCYLGSGRLELRDLAFEWTGDNPAVAADVVVCFGGDVLIERCRFGGASSRGPKYGAGLEFHGSARGSVVDCEMGRNGHGMIIEGQADVVLRRNTCSNNTRNGILLGGRTRATVEENVCNGNKFSGIHFMLQSQGTGSSNICMENGLTGISVGPESRASLRANTCGANTYVGIFCESPFPVELQANICRYNAGGMLIGAGAKPLVERNICEGNRKHGLAYIASASGTARGNTCSKNAGDGINVDQEAHPVLEGNICDANRLAGIDFSGKAAGLARANRCTANSLCGITVEQRATPGLQDNVCLDNQRAGIYVTVHARPELTSNHCAGNLVSDFWNERKGPRA